MALERNQTISDIRKSSDRANLAAVLAQFPDLELKDFSIPLSSSRNWSLFSLLSNAFQHRRVQITDTHERELRFFALLDKVKEAFDLDNLPHKRITQRYFASEFVPLIASFVCHALKNKTTFSPTEFKRARIRDVEHNGTHKYYLEIKGPRNNHEKLDLSIPISADLYNQLSNFTDGSLLIKRRYEVKGLAGRASRINMHIDVIERVANREKFVDIGTVHTKRGDIAFAILEVEARSNAAIKKVLSGKHNLDILNDAIPLWNLKRFIRSPLSSWRLSHADSGKGLSPAISLLAKKAA